MFCFSQKRILVADLIDETFSTTVACFKVFCHRVSSGWKADPRCSRIAKKAVVRRLEKAAFAAGMDVDLGARAAEAALRVASLLLEMANAIPL